METLAPSLQPQTGSSNASETSTVQYAAERARLLLGCFRRGEANDPETYVAAVAAVLSCYPAETIRHVTDPRTGLASNPRRDPKTGHVWTGLPDVAGVRMACEDHHGPVRRAMEREAAERRQIAERKRLAIPDGRPKKTYDELVEDCRARGLEIGAPKTRKPTMPVTEWLDQMGVSREQFDAIPDIGSPNRSTRDRN